MTKKLIYILNHYSKDSVEHFYHVIHLLECIADRDVEIALIIEKCDDEHIIRHDNIHIIAQKEKTKIKRIFELYNIVKNHVKEKGYKTVFVRISTYAAIVSCVASHRYGGRVYYWLSGASLDSYKDMTFANKVRYFIKDHLRYKTVTKMVDYFVTGPEYMVEYYATVGKVKRDKLRLLYNDIDTSRFKKIDASEKCALKKELGLRADALTILLVHRYSGVRKTVYYIPYIFEKMRDRKDIEVILIGDGPDKDAVTKAVTDSKLGFVKMIDSQPNAIIQRYYQACDIFINPSWTEGFPRVVIEAMACGMPVVATDAGGTKDLFGEKQIPYIIDKENRDGFSEAIMDMVESEDVRYICGTENEKRARRYDTKTVSKMYTDLFWD